MRYLIPVLLLTSTGIAAEPVVHRDLAYVEPKNVRQTLDVYSPAEGQDHPVVFWIHGGGWQRGDKTEVDHKPKAFTDRGYVFVSTNYRFVPHVTIQQMAADVAQAIRYTHEHAREYGGNPSHFIIAGHSAGAQLAALVCMDDRYLRAEGLRLSFIKGCVPVDGDTYDVPLQIATVEERRANSYRMKFGNEASQKELSPVTHIARGKGIPPVLILHVADHPETTLQSRRLVRRLTQTGIRARAYPAERTDHVKLNADLGLPGDRASSALFEFINEALKKR